MKSLDDFELLFMRASELHCKRFMELSWDGSPSWRDHWVDALKVFLLSYAYERQGRDPSYAPAAVDAISEASEPAKVWERYKELLRPIKKGLSAENEEKLLMMRHQPIHHDEMCYNPRAKSCVFCVLKGRNLVLEIKRLFDEDKTKEAYRMLTGIKGVGDKIAALFLRDVAVYLKTFPRSGREFLQPIDEWVKRVVEILARRELDVGKARDREFAKSFIVDNFNEPERVNQGMWYFAVHVALSHYRLHKLLSRPTLAAEHLDRHVERLKTLSDRLSSL